MERDVPGAILSQDLLLVKYKEIAVAHQRKMKGDQLLFTAVQVSFRKGTFIASTLQ